MKTILVIFILVLIAAVIVSLINVSLLRIQVTKSKELNTMPNELEKKYQFIKGLY